MYIHLFFFLIDTLKSDETRSSPLNPEEKIYTNIETDSTKKNALLSMDATPELITAKIDTNTELMQIDEPTAMLSNNHSSDETIAALPAGKKNDIVVENNNTVNEHKMDIDDIEIDEGELSDASTILLDEEELRHVYTQNPATSESIVSESQHNESNIAELSTSQKEDTVDNSIVTDSIGIDEGNTQTPSLKKSKVIIADMKEEAAQSPAIPEENLMKEEPILIPNQQSLPINIEADKSTEKEDLVTVLSLPSTTKEESPTKEEKLIMEDVEKKIVKKISLQEYLSKQQKSIHP